MIIKFCFQLPLLQNASMCILVHVSLHRYKSISSYLHKGDSLDCGLSYLLLHYRLPPCSLKWQAKVDLHWQCRRGLPGLPIPTKDQHVSALITSQSNGVKEFLIIVLFFTYLSVTSNLLPANYWLNLLWSHGTLIKMPFTKNNNTQLKQLKYITRSLEVKWLYLVTLVALGKGFCFSSLPSSMMAFGLSPDNRLTVPPHNIYNSKSLQTT